MVKASGIITLMTDFGTADVFVGVMKGVIARINPPAKVIDLSHEITPFDAIEAACLLRDAYGFFPEGTVHTVVVDPGVGTPRRIVAMEAGGHLFVAPDTGILGPIADRDGCGVLVGVTEGRFFLPAVSGTFHGRDIFAPVAAHLSAGLPLTELGPQRESLARLSLPEPESLTDDRIRGQVLRFDRFGNLITNIGADQLSGHRDMTIGVAGRTVRGLRDTFAQANPGELVAYLGSFGALEIAVNRGNARKELDAYRGDPVEVTFPEAKQ